MSAGFGPRVRQARRICVVTGSRADYGFLRWVMSEIAEAPDVELAVIATGMHLDPRQGMTVGFIEADGFAVDRSVPVFSQDNSPLGLAASLGDGVGAIARAIADVDPDWIVVLGDRVEALSAALAAHALQVPIAHIHGGELTASATDDAYRHAITKLATLHFPCTETYRRRIIQLGEQPSRVFNVGALAVESVLRTAPMPTSQLFDGLTVDPESLLLLTYHPVTLHSDLGVSGLVATLEALDHFSDMSVLITGPNSDAGGARMADMLIDFAEASSGRVQFVSALGQPRYINMLRCAKAVLGNSSSTLLEASITGTPGVDIGPRQRGRLRPPSAIHCEASHEEIAASLQHVLSDDFRQLSRRSTHVFGDGTASRRIVEILGAPDLEATVAKEFFDVPWSEVEEA